MSDRPSTGSRGLQLHEACVQGDMAALRAGLDDADFPNCDVAAVGGGPLLHYCIYWSPLAFIEELLALGADINPATDDGFPTVIAALSSERPERDALLQLLIEQGADVNARGLNDWTPLHWAVANRDLSGIELLLKAGADPTLATRIDDETTPLDDAIAIGFTEAVEVLRRGELEAGDAF